MEVVQAAYLIKACFALFGNVFLSVKVSVVGSKALANSTAQLRLYTADFRVGKTAHKQFFHQADGIAGIDKLSVNKACQIFFGYLRFLQIGKFFTSYQLVVVKKFPERAHLFHYVDRHCAISLCLIFLFQHKRPVFKTVVHNKTARNYMVYFTFGQLI